jgi:hypothetical protein
MMQWVIERLGALLERIQALAKDRRDLRDNALRTISHALNETYLYYEGLENGKKRSRDIEAQISRYWSAAAIPMRHLDRELSQVCEYKSQFWVSPDHWQRRDISAVNIGLESVRARYRKLLVPKGFSKTVPKPRARRLLTTASTRTRAKTRARR